ncbi:MAG: hypothetical protein N2166_02195 [candidate division WOR-3 bacterium]|nr:hypothetical protein [candidate division WOR-3 bacterium]
MNNFLTKSVLICIIGLSITSSVFADQIVKLRRNPRFSYEHTLEYDNNIFLYSPEALEEFRNNIRSYRFPFRTTDDLIANYKIRFTLPLRIFKKRSDILINYSAKVYTVNTAKSYQTINPSLQIQLVPNFTFRLSYLLIPNYLIRYYKDPQSSRSQYIPCQFTEHLFTSTIWYKFAQITISPRVRYEFDDYIKKFNFYDGTAWRYGIRISLPVTKNILLHPDWERKHNNAAGPVPDISYCEDKFSCDWQINFSGKITLESTVEYAIRRYITTNPPTIDPYHYQRKDAQYSFNINLSYRLKNNWQLFGKYLYALRKTTSPLLIDITEIKDYNNYKISFGVGYNMSINVAEKQEDTQ